MDKKWNTIKKDIDSLIQLAYRVKVDSIECPPKEDMWGKVSQNLEKKHRFNMFASYKPAIAVCFIVILSVALLLVYQIDVSAFTKSIVKSVMQITENTFQLKKSVNDNDEQIFDDPRLNDTQSKINFELVIPKYIPDGFSIKQINMINNVIENETVVIEYININKDFIIFTQKNNPNSTLNILKEESTKVEEITINDTKITLFNYDDEYYLVLWDKSNISYKINTNINYNELMKVCESID